MSAESSVAGLPGAEDRIRFRLAPAQAIVLCLPYLAVAAEQVLFYVSSRDRPAFPSPLFEFACAATAISLFVLTARYYGATLTPSGVLVHSIRRRTVAWPDVAAVQVEPTMGTRYVVFYERTGRRTRLRCPSAGFLSPDRNFDAKVALIHDYWTRYSAGTLASSGEPSLTGFRGRPDMLRARPAWTQRIIVVYLCLALVMEVWLITQVDAQGNYHPTAAGKIAVAAATVAALLAGWQWSRRSGVTLEPRALTVHRMRTRQIAWSHIQSVTIRRRLGGARLVIRERDGRLTALPCPRAGLLLWDSDFGVKAMTVRRRWLEHRGDAWAAVGVTGRTEGFELADVMQLGSRYRALRASVLAVVLVAMTFELLMFLLLGALTVASSS